MPHPLFDAALDKLKIAMFDLETTGLYASKDRIIQMAVVPFANNELEDDGWSQLVNPGADHLPLRDLIENLTGITTAQVQAAAPLSAVIHEFDQRVGTRVIAGHNIRAFDIKFMRKAEQRHNVDLQLDYYIDTLMLMRKLHPELPGFSLSKCADFYDLNYDPDELHNALADTRLNAQLLQAQIVELSQVGVRSFSDYFEFVN